MKKAFRKILMVFSILILGFNAYAAIRFSDGYFKYSIDEYGKDVWVEGYPEYWKSQTEEYELDIPSEVIYGGEKYKITAIVSEGFCDYFGLTSLIIPNSIEFIDWHAFHNCANLKNVIIGNSVKVIEGGAFARCEKLTSLDISNSVITIKGSAFANCYNLKSLTIGNSVTSIESQAFINASFQSVDIPNSVTRIDYRVFGGCKNLKTITIGSSVETFGRNVFDDCRQIEEVNCKSILPPKAPDEYATHDIFEYDVYKHATLYVPKGCKNVYMANKIWGQFKKIEEKDFAGIGNIIAEEDVPNVSVDGNSIIVNGIEPDTQITIYEMSGRVIYQGQNHVVDGLERGIYIIQAGGKTFKVII